MTEAMQKDSGYSGRDSIFFLSKAQLYDDY